MGGSLASTYILHGGSHIDRRLLIELGMLLYKLGLLLHELRGGAEPPRA